MAPLPRPRFPRLARLTRPVRLRNPVTPRLRYAPRRDGLPDPGEVVWAWVAYEEDPGRGKDRPVLVVGEEGEQLLALALTSRDHDRDEEQERREGREWMDVGSGDWDSQRRPSEVRLDRLLRLDRSTVRREGASLDRDLFEAVVRAARPFWSE